MLTDVDANSSDKDDFAGKIASRNLENCRGGKVDGGGTKKVEEKAKGGNQEAGLRNG